MPQEGTLTPPRIMVIVDAESEPHGMEGPRRASARPKQGPKKASGRPLEGAKPVAHLQKWMGA